MTVISVEGLEAFTDKYLADQAKRLRPVRPLIEGISGTHQTVDEPAEGLRRPSRAAMRLGQHHFKNTGHPTVPGRAIVHPVRAEFSKELGDAHARSVREVLRFGRAARIFRTEISTHQIAKRFKCPLPELDDRAPSPSLPHGGATLTRRPSLSLAAPRYWQNGPKNAGAPRRVRARDLRCRKVDTFDSSALTNPFPTTPENLTTHHQSQHRVSISTATTRIRPSRTAKIENRPYLR